MKSNLYEVKDVTFPNGQVGKYMDNTVARIFTWSDGNKSYQLASTGNPPLTDDELAKIAASLR